MRARSRYCCTSSRRASVVIQSTTGATRFRRPQAAYNATNGNYMFVWEHTDGSAQAMVRSSRLQRRPLPNSA